MRPASAPRPAGAIQMVLVDVASGTVTIRAARDLSHVLGPDDLVVVNDAATLPASFDAVTPEGERVELRLAGASDDDAFWAVLLGEGSYVTPTELRSAPPPVAIGDILRIGDGSLAATVTGRSALSPRLVKVRFDLPGRDHRDAAAIWAALYATGRPVQYAYVPRPLALWDVQNVYAGRPWAVESPSAGRAIEGSVLATLARRGVRVRAITHAAGLSSTGDPAIDARLPLAERYMVPAPTWSDVLATKARGGRVVAIGTSVVRALESAARGPREGTTELRIGPETRRLVVDAVLTGIHEVDTSHFALLGAFAPAPLLAQAHAEASRRQLLGHEFGDACLVFASPRQLLESPP